MASKRKRSKARASKGQLQKRAKTDGDTKPTVLVQLGEPKKPAAPTPRQDHGVKQDLLERYFPRVETLRAYLLTRLPATSRLRRKKLSAVGKQPDATEVEKLLSHVLDTTLVGCADSNHKALSDGQPASDDNDRDRLRETFSQTRRADESYVTVSSAAEGFFSPQSEIVDFVIWLLFQRTDKTSAFKGPDNVICHGFRFQRDKRPPAWNSNLETTEGRPDDLPAYAIPNVYVARNPQNAQTLKEAPWPQMLAILGAASEKIMTDLLLDCSLFLPVGAGDGNFVQLTGKPLFGAIFFTDAKVPPSQVNKADAKPKPLSDITFSRSRMFYKKASLTKLDGKVHFGLTRKHVFNRLPFLLEAPSAPPSKKDASKEPPCLLKLRGMVAQNQPVGSLNKEGTIRTAMHIFSRQFGLQNVFSLPTGQVPLDLRNFAAREKEIVAKFGVNKTQDKELKIPVPKRLRGTPLQLVEKMRTLHRKCIYPALLKYYCPEHHKGSAPGTVPLVQLATPVPQVSAFCKAVFQNVIPDEFWGSGDIQTHNKAEFFKKVDSFVRLQRHEKLSLHTALQSLKIAEIPWLAPPKLKYSKLSKTDLEKRQEIFAEFIYFLFESFLVPLLATNFYVTESNLHRNQVFYFRHDVWQRISIPAMTAIKASRLEKVDTKEATHSELGFGRLRLLPKNSTVRAITNLRHRAPKKGKLRLAPSINTALRPVAAMFAFEMQEHPERLGSGMLSTRGMYSRLKDFKQRMHAKGKKAFYFAKVDVTSAFDTIPQEAMSRLLGTIPEHAAYNIEQHVEISATEYNAVHSVSAGSNKNFGPRKTWKTTARPSDDRSGFHDAVKNSMAQNMRNTVFVETSSRWTHGAETLAQKAASHIRKNIVKIGNKFYRQKEGIPQGSVLSAVLCSYFYADLEKRELGFLKGKDSDSEDCLLLRLIDDFLLISVDRAKAARFVEVMQQGHPQYGVSVNPSKSLVNFYLEINGRIVPKLASGLPFPYCGTTIHCSTLDLAKDRESKPQNLFNSITVEHTRSQGYQFQRRVLNYFQIQSHQMFFDTSFNSRRTILRNLHSAFAETANKMWAYARCMPKAKRPSAQLTIRTIEEVGGMAFGILNSKMRAQQYPDYKFDVSKPHLRYLLLHAFYVVLGKKQTEYKDVIAYLHDTMRQLQTRGRARLPREFMLHGTTK